MRRGLLIAAAVLFVGLSASGFLCVAGFSIWEWKRFGRAYLLLYGIEGALTFPAHLAAGLRGEPIEGVAVRVWSVAGAAAFWGAGAGLAEHFRRRAIWVALGLMVAWSAYEGAVSMLTR